MDAINQLTIECLESNHAPKKPDPRNRLYSLSKLLALIKVNLFRLDLFWELVIAHFICIISNKNTSMIHNYTETLSTIIFMTFDYLSNLYSKHGQ